MVIDSIQVVSLIRSGQLVINLLAAAFLETCGQFARQFAKTNLLAKLADELNKFLK